MARNIEVIYHDDFIEKKIYFENSHVLRDNWLERYQLFAENNPYLVEVFSVDPLIEDGAPQGSALMRMEKIDMITTLEDALLHDHDDDLAPVRVRPKLVHEALMVLNKCMVQTLSNRFPPLDQYFFNSDFKLNNIVVTSDYNLRVIDPDSYNTNHDLWNYEKLAMSHTQMLGIIRRHL